MKFLKVSSGKHTYISYPTYRNKGFILPCILKVRFNYTQGWVAITSRARFMYASVPFEEASYWKTGLP